MEAIEGQLRHEHAFVEKSEVLISKKPQQDVLDQLKKLPVPPPKTPREVEPGLSMPLSAYLDHLEEGEKIYLVLHEPWWWRLGPREVIATTEKLIVSGSRVVSIKNCQLPYARILVANVLSLKLDTASYFFMKLDLAPSPVSLSEIRPPGTPPLVEYFGTRMLLAKIPRNSPFVAILAAVGKIPVVLK
jgi:hypothetical protein